MTIVEILRAIVTGYATLWALYLVLIPLVANLWRSKVRTGKRTTGTNWPTIAVIVPGRNVAQVIAQCLSALSASHYPMEKVALYVVADHCTDDTAERARACGASVLTRHDGLAGKTYTLAWALDTLAARRVTPDLYVIVDATAQVEAYFLTAMAKCWQRGEHIIANHTIVSAENQMWYARCLALMFVHRNLQNWSRERMRLSAMLTGCGMAFSSTYIQRFGWRLALPTARSGSHPTEDWRHAVQAIEQGYRVAFAPEARVATPLRKSLAAATQQGARWERGRMTNAATHALRLLLHSVWQCNLIKMCAALDALQPPVAILGALSFGLFALSSVTPGTSLSITVGCTPLVLIGLYGLGVVIRGRHEGIGFATAMWAPLYVVWRCMAFCLAWGFLDRLDLHRGRKHKARGQYETTTPAAPDKSSPTSPR